jgi:hypothetical protein
MWIANNGQGGVCDGKTKEMRKEMINESRQTGKRMNDEEGNGLGASTRPDASRVTS